MAPLIIPDSKATPLVALDPDNGVLLFAGSSLPENTTEFYAPVMQWMRSHVNELPEGSALTFRLDYFNTSSLKVICFILNTVNEANTMHQRGLRVVWCEEEGDEFMEDAAENIEAVIGLKLERVTVDPRLQPLEGLLAQHRMPRTGAA